MMMYCLFYLAPLKHTVNMDLIITCAVEDLLNRLIHLNEETIWYLPLTYSAYTYIPYGIVLGYTE